MRRHTRLGWDWMVLAGPGAALVIVAVGGMAWYSSTVLSRGGEVAVLLGPLPALILCLPIFMVGFAMLLLSLLYQRRLGISGVGWAAWILVALVSAAMLYGSWVLMNNLRSDVQFPASTTDWLVAAAPALLGIVGVIVAVLSLVPARQHAQRHNDDDNEAPPLDGS